MACSVPSGGCCRSSAWPGSSAATADGGYRDLDRVAELWPEEGYGGLFRSDRDRALGWLAMERSGAGVAHEVLLRGARLAAERGAYALEAMLRHDVVRFGGAAAVVDRLVELASSIQGPLAAARADHAAGVVAVDALRLRSAVAGFEQIGSPAARRRGGARPRGRGDGDRR